MELFKLFGTIAVKNSEANSAIDETTDKAKSFSENLSDKFTDIGEKTTKLGAKMSFGLTTPITLIGTKAIQATADFESAMSEVGAISGATGDDLIALEKKAKEEAREKEAAEKARKKVVEDAARSAAGTIGREVGNQIGKSVGGSFGKRLGGNIGASLGRGILGTLFGKK